eukprot:m.77091 g.77091  ORF g.77091 m.77091 type:complete len:371 (-) comp13205_c0_seq2:691-1803(-)
MADPGASVLHAEQFYLNSSAEAGPQIAETQFYALPNTHGEEELYGNNPAAIAAAAAATTAAPVSGEAATLAMYSVPHRGARDRTSSSTSGTNAGASAGNTTASAPDVGALYSVPRHDSTVSARSNARSTTQAQPSSTAANPFVPAMYFTPPSNHASVSSRPGAATGSSTDTASNPRDMYDAANHGSVSLGLVNHYSAPSNSETYGAAQHVLNPGLTNLYSAPSNTPGRPLAHQDEFGSSDTDAGPTLPVKRGPGAGSGAGAGAGVAGAGADGEAVVEDAAGAGAAATGTAFAGAWVGTSEGASAGGSSLLACLLVSGDRARLAVAEEREGAREEEDEPRSAGSLLSRCSILNLIEAIHSSRSRCDVDERR